MGKMYYNAIVFRVQNTKTITTRYKIDVEIAVNKMKTAKVSGSDIIEGVIIKKCIITLIGRISKILEILKNGGTSVSYDGGGVPIYNSPAEIIFQIMTVVRQFC